MMLKQLPRVSSLALLLLVCLAAAGRGQAKPVRLGTSPQLEYFNLSSRQTAAVLADGRFAAVWTQDPQAFRPTDVRLQFVNGDGAPAFPGLGRAVASSAASETTPVVAAHAREGALVALQRLNPRTLGSRLVVQWLDGQGRPRWGRGAFAAPVSRQEFQTSPSLLASSDGGAFVCFLREAARTPAVFETYCQRFSPEGRQLWGKGGVRAAALSSAARLAQRPQAVADGEGGLLVFWHEAGRAGANRAADLYRGQRLGPDGRALWGSEGRTVYTARLPVSDGYELVSDGSGGAILGLADWPGLPHGADERDVIVQRVSGDGESLWGDGAIVASGPFRELDSLFPGPDGGAFVGVLTHRPGEGGVRLAFHRVTADGRAVWPADGVPVVDPAVAADEDVDLNAFGSFDDGALRFAWEHHAGGGLAHSEIRFGALDPAGTRLSGAAGIPLASAANRNRTRGFAFDPETGAAFAVWERFLRDDVDVLGAVYTPPPPGS